MKKLITLTIVLATATAIALQTTAVAAVNYHNVISDHVFDDSGSMSAGQIDTFLNTFPSSCISKSNGYTFANPAGYSPSTGFRYGGNVSAGTAISHAAQAYGINPQVLLSTLQKEQSLVSGGGGCSTLRYAGAMGYGCPDSGTTHSYSGVQLYVKNGHAVTSVSGTCVNKSTYVGFTRQIINAAWLLTFDRHRSEGQNRWYVNKSGWDNSDDLGFCYSGPMTQGTFAVCPSGSAAYYDGYITIDGVAIHMDNGATAALYHYTPHKNGQASFYNVFTRWFGSTQKSVNYGVDVLSKKVYSDAAHTHEITSATIALTPGQKVYPVITIKNVGANPLSSSFTRVATDSPRNRTNSPFRNNTWIANNRPTHMLNSVVSTGQTSLFYFSLTAPGTNGTYTESYGLVADGRAWMDQDIMTLHFSVSGGTQPPQAPTSLAPGKVLNPGKYLKSDNGRYKFVMQGDGNLVLYSSRGRALWNTRTNNKGGYKFVMQGDGNLVLYNTHGRPLWDTHTNNKGGYKLVMQNDGNLVLYAHNGRPLWDTHTNGRY